MGQSTENPINATGDINKFADDDILTQDITYTAVCWKLTAIQWKIINGSDYWNIFTVAAFGILLGIIIDIGVSVVDYKSFEYIKTTDLNKFYITLIILVFLVFISILTNGDKRKIKRSINEKLLSDEELGITIKKRKWMNFK